MQKNTENRYLPNRNYQTRMHCSHNMQIVHRYFTLKNQNSGIHYTGTALQMYSNYCCKVNKGEGSFTTIKF